MAQLKIRYLESDRPQRPDRSHYAVSVMVTPDKTPWSCICLDNSPPFSVKESLGSHRDYAIFLWHKPACLLTDVVSELLKAAVRKHAQTMTIFLPHGIEEEFDDDACPGAIKQGAVEGLVKLIKESGLESVFLNFAAPCVVSQGFGLFEDP